MRQRITRQILSTTAMFGLAIALQACGSQQVATKGLEGEGIIMTAVYSGEHQAASLSFITNTNLVTRSLPPVILAAAETKEIAPTVSPEPSSNAAAKPTEETTVIAQQSVVFKKHSPIAKKTDTQDSSMEFASSVSDGELDKTRGGFTDATDPMNLNLLQATSVGNNTSGVVTGLNLISNDALNNTQGVVSLIQNSGNNVVIQSATIVNLTMTP